MKRIQEKKALGLIQSVIDMDKQDGDCLPGTVIRLMKLAKIYLKKRMSVNGKRKTKKDK